MPAAHAPSLYAATADPTLAFPPLAGSTKANVAIIGGGYTGLSAALHLAEAGVDVVLLEAERVGWGASGRNGGQLHSGQRRDQDWLEEHLGVDDALRLWNLAEEAKALVHCLVAKHAIACDWRPGLIETTHKRRLLAGEIAYVEKLKQRYHYRQVEWLDRPALAEAIGTDVYFGGRRDIGGGHLDPLKFAQGLARAAAKSGARIHEGTKATGISDGAVSRIKTPHGDVTADIVVLAGNGYLDGIDDETEARVMPIDNYILATEPIGAGMPGGLIPGGEAVSDTRFVVYYFRPTNGRILFGGGETYSPRTPPDVALFVRHNLARIYPQLGDAKIDYAWGGTLAITLPRLPFIRRIRPGVYTAGGYSGQGVALAPFAGKVLAAAIRGDVSRLDVFAALPVPPFPGGKLLRRPALMAGMLWYSLRDRL
jgi:gamma-glutamylputrescine oxidase